MKTITLIIVTLFFNGLLATPLNFKLPDLKEFPTEIPADFQVVNMMQEDLPVHLDQWQKSLSKRAALITNPLELQTIAPLPEEITQTKIQESMKTQDIGKFAPLGNLQFRKREAPFEVQPVVITIEPETDAVNPEEVKAQLQELPSPLLGKALTKRAALTAGGAPVETQTITLKPSEIDQLTPEETAFQDHLMSLGKSLSKRSLRHFAERYYDFDSANVHKEAADQSAVTESEVKTLII